MTHTATVTLKKGEDTVKRDVLHGAVVKVGDIFVIGGESWVVDKVHGKEPGGIQSDPDPVAKPQPKPARPDPIEQPKPVEPRPHAKAAPAKQHHAANKHPSHRR